MERKYVSFFPFGIFCEWDFGYTTECYALVFIKLSIFNI